MYLKDINVLMVYKWPWFLVVCPICGQNNVENTQCKRPGLLRFVNLN